MYYDGLKKIARSLPYQTLFVKPPYQVYNRDMSPRHFANYAKNDPQQYNQFSDNMWNGFVTVTKHIPFMNRFFSFTPDFLQGLDAKEIGKQLGEVYNLTMTDDPIIGTFADGEIPGDQDQTL